MFEAELLIPLAGNDGAPFLPTHFEVFEMKASEMFGGVTRLETSVNGVWLDDGTLYRDHLVRYVVALKGIGEGAKLAALADFAKTHFAQLAVYVRYLGQAEII